MRRKVTTTSADFANLRTKIDSNDPFFKGSRMIEIPIYEKKIPKWINDAEKTQEILLKSFPKLKTDPNQRKAAGRWNRIIHLYWHLNYTHEQIVSEFNDTNEKQETLYSIRSVIRSIKRVSKGIRANGTGKFSGKRGRPKGK